LTLSRRVGHQECRTVPDDEYDCTDQLPFLLNGLYPFNLENLYRGRMLRLWCSIGLVLFASAVGAAESLTLEQALNLAERHHPRLQDATVTVAGASAGIVTARAYPNPMLDFTLGDQHARRTGAVAGFYQYYVFSQPIELPSLRQPRIEAAEQAHASSELALAETRLAVQTAVRHAFYESLRWEGAIELAQDTFRLIEELRRRIQVRVEVGEAGRLELIRAEAEVATARTFANTVQRPFVTAIAALRAATGGAMTADIDPDGTLESLPLVPSFPKLRQQVINDHPTLKQARTEISRSEALLRTEIALRTPQPSVRFEWERLPDTTLYRFGLAFPLPLWNRREGPIGEAEAALQRARASLDKQLLEITAALENAYGRYEVATQQVAAFEGGVLQEANEAVRAAEAAYQLGERGMMDVLDAQRVLRSVRIDFLNAQYDRQSALTDLRQLRALDLQVPLIR
jgi:cobalt-zinc-cadmium efflux system outer membrane protein